MTGDQADTLDLVIKGLIGGAVITLLYVFIRQIMGGLWITAREYNAVLAMKDKQLGDKDAEIRRLEGKLETADTTLREAARTLNIAMPALVQSQPRKVEP